MIDDQGYRANVGIVICNSNGELLWAKRIGQDAWQFPQGGIKNGESPEDALYRELDEEVNRLLESGSEGEEYDNVVDQAKAVETRFAVDHPVAERFLREIIEALSRVGI